MDHSKQSTTQVDRNDDHPQARNGKRPPIRRGLFARPDAAALTEGPILPALVRLAVPIVIGQLFQTIYNVVDTFWVGRLGSEAVAAISLSFPIIFFLISLAAGLTLAGTALVAQHVGARDRRGASRVAAQSLAASIGAAMVISVVGVNISPTLLRWLGSAPSVLPMAASYLNIILSGIVFMFMSFTYASILRGVGDPVTPMRLRAISVLLNVILDPLFIFGWLGFPEMGVAGAAVATIISRGFEGILGVYLLLRGSEWLRFNVRMFRPDWSVIRKLVTIGAPSAAEMSTRSLGLSFMTATVALFGTAAVAAYGIGMRVLSLVMLPSMGVGMATTTLVGQNLGANQPRRAETTTWLATGITFALLTVFGLLVFAFPRVVIGIFNREAAVLELGSNFLRTVGLGFGVIGALTVISGGFRGAGDTLPAMVFSLISQLVIQVPLAFGLSRLAGFGTSGIWLGILLANIAGTAAAAVWFRRGHWKHMAVVQRGRPQVTSDEEF